VQQLISLVFSLGTSDYDYGDYEYDDDDNNKAPISPMSQTIVNVCCS